MMITKLSHKPLNSALSFYESCDDFIMLTPIYYYFSYTQFNLHLKEDNYLHSLKAMRSSKALPGICPIQGNINTNLKKAVTTCACVLDYIVDFQI